MKTALSRGATTSSRVTLKKLERSTAQIGEIDDKHIPDTSQSWRAVYIPAWSLTKAMMETQWTFGRMLHWFSDCGQSFQAGAVVPLFK